MIVAAEKPTGIAFLSNRCECYKKLHFLGVPLYKTDENEEFAEGYEDILFESSFQLPGELIINPQITEYPVVHAENLPVVFRQMAKVIPNLSDFELNVLSFWVLDMFVEGLWTAQNAGMNHDHQRATLLWIAYFYNYIQKENPSRKELFLHLKIVLFTSNLKKNSEYSGEEMLGEFSSDFTTSGKDSSKENNADLDVWELPLPPGSMLITTESDLIPTDVFTISDGIPPSESIAEDGRSFSVPMEPDGNEAITERNKCHMKIILEILYRMLWVYLEIQGVFHAMPNIEQVDLPFNLGVPKPTAKADTLSPSKSEKFGRKVPGSEDLSEGTEMEKELHKNDCILPLQAAEESKAYLRHIFGQPTSDRSIFSKGKDRRK